MIAASRSVAGLALAGSLVLHLAGIALDKPTRAPVKVAGGGGAEVAMLGNGFADMVEGTVSPTQPTEAETPQEVEPASEPPPDNAEETVTPDTAPTPPPVATAVTPALTPVTPPVSAVVPGPAPAPHVAAALMPTAAAVTEAKPEQAPATDPPEVTSVTVPPTATPPVLATEEVTATEPLTRPRTRPRDFAETLPPELRKPANKPRAQPQAKPAGNAAQSAKRGSDQGARTASTNATSTGNGRNAAEGNAAASNYPGEVFRKISRVRRPRIKSRGAALVAFTISGNGALASVGLQRSSGSADLDRAAIRIVQRAAPFPSPPPNARTRYSIEIRGE